jgi:hypothetical protein
LTVRDLAKSMLARAGYKLERTRPRRAVSTSSGTRISDLGDVKDLAYRVGEWRYRVPVTDLVGRSCFGYDRSSWHPFVSAVREIVEGRAMVHEESTLTRFYERWNPTSIAETHLPADPARHNDLIEIPARSLFEPWIKRPPPCDDPRHIDCSPAGSPLFGPITPERAEAQFDRLKRMLRSIETYGYDPDGFPRGLIRIVVLRHEGSLRFLVAHGQHRAAVLSALGHESIDVGIFDGLPALIDTSEAERWPHVRSGLITPELGIELAARYFEPSLTRHAQSVAAIAQ